MYDITLRFKVLLPSDISPHAIRYLAKSVHCTRVGFILHLPTRTVSVGSFVTFPSSHLTYLCPSLHVFSLGRLLQLPTRNRYLHLEILTNGCRGSSMKCLATALCYQTIAKLSHRSPVIAHESMVPIRMIVVSNTVYPYCLFVFIAYVTNPS